MKNLLAAPLIALAAIAPATAQEPRPATVTVTMENFKFTPPAVQLKAGVPAVDTPPCALVPPARALDAPPG